LVLVIRAWNDELNSGDTIVYDGGEVTSTTNEIPSWIKNNAGWWSENLITEKEFIDGLQWLINNGIIQVIET